MVLYSGEVELVIFEGVEEVVMVMIEVVGCGVEAEAATSMVEAVICRRIEEEGVRRMVVICSGSGTV